MPNSKVKNEMLAKAEVCAKGRTVNVTNVEETKFIINHLVYLVKGCEEDTSLAEEIYKKAMQFNSNGAVITHINVARFGDIGTLLTLVRDEEMTDLTSEDGVLAYVYNFNYPECSELGYVFFERAFDKGGAYARRYA